MTSRRTRTRHHRRDRRKAKMSNWKREGKQSMSGSRVAHGNANTVGHVGSPPRSATTQPTETMRATAKQSKFALKTSIENLTAHHAASMELRMSVFKVSAELADWVREADVDWAVTWPRRVRTELSSGVLTALSVYRAFVCQEDDQPKAHVITCNQPPSGTLPLGIQPALTKIIDEHMRLPEDILIALMYELRLWVQKGRKRSREFPWGTLTSEGEYLWLTPKELPKDSWATPRETVPVALDPREFLK